VQSQALPGIVPRQLEGEHDLAGSAPVASGAQAVLLYRRPGGTAGAGNGDEPLALGEVPCAAVGEGEPAGHDDKMA
jgi:hypothetical protein